MQPCRGSANGVGERARERERAGQQDKPNYVGQAGREEGAGAGGEWVARGSGRKGEKGWLERERGARQAGVVRQLQTAVVQCNSR